MLIQLLPLLPRRSPDHALGTSVHKGNGKDRGCRKAPASSIRETLRSNRYAQITNVNSFFPPPKSRS